jgi:NAD(P)-dependent dehydrogenase (short-subunit alcohol dehydrogenase family)
LAGELDKFIIHVMYFQYRVHDCSTSQRRSDVVNAEVAVVTGAGGALGRAAAIRLARDGFGVAVLDRDAESLAETAARVRGEGGTVREYVTDLADVGALRGAISRVEGEFGPISALLNNAAIYPATPFLDIPVEEYDLVIAVNQRAYFVAAQSAARCMSERGRGAIVNVASITSHGGWANLASYVSTKGAAVALTHALARELGPAGIRVNAVSPGAFPTAAETIHDDPEAYQRFVLDHQSLKRRGTGAEFAAVVSFLISEEASFVTGQVLNIDGGWVMNS